MKRALEIVYYKNDKLLDNVDIILLLHFSVLFNQKINRVLSDFNVGSKFLVYRHTDRNVVKETDKHRLTDKHIQKTDTLLNTYIS